MIITLPNGVTQLYKGFVKSQERAVELYQKLTRLEEKKECDYLLRYVANRGCSLLYGIPAFASFLGFTSSGIAPGSWASTIMPALANVDGGGVASGCVAATLCRSWKRGSGVGGDV
jgi:hypothetical protein